MKRVDGFGAGQSSDEGWVVVRVKLRPAVANALKNEAIRESAELHRRVHVSDLMRDAIRIFLAARRIDPYGKIKRRFMPSEKSGTPR